MRSCSVPTSSHAASWRSRRCANRPRRNASCPWPTSSGGRANSSHNPAFISGSPMASHLDLEEQEQLDQVKAFWQQYGNLVTWLLVIALGAYAAWNGWNWYQRDQATKAGAMYDELDAAAQVGDADRANRVFADLRGRYPGTAFAEQGGLVAARVLFEKGQAEAPGGGAGQGAGAAPRRWRWP